MPKYLFLSAALLSLYGWAAPHHRSPWVAFYNEAPFAIALLLLGVAVSLGKRTPLERAESIPTAAMLLILLALVPLLQLFAGKIVFAGDAWMPSLYLLAAGFACVVGSRLDRQFGDNFLDLFAVVCLVGSMTAVFLALHQWLRLDGLGVWLTEMRPNGRPYANLAQPNNLATLLCCGVAAAVHLRNREKFGATTFVLLGILLICGIAMSRSRTAFLTVAVFTASVLYGRRRSLLRFPALGIAASASAFVLLWVLWPALSNFLLVYSEPTDERLDGRAFRGDLRLVIWSQLLDALWRQPIGGYGWNQLALAQVFVAAEHPDSLFVEHSHNILLDLLLWNGVILGGLVVALLTAWSVSRLRGVLSSGAWFALSFILIVGTHALVELPLAYAYFLLPVALCVGVIEDRHQGSRHFQVSRWVLPATATVGIVLTAWVSIEYLRLEADFEHLRYEAAGIRTPAAPSEIPSVYLLTSQREFLRFARTQARERMTDEELRWMEQVAHRHAHPSALFRYALALGLNHRYEAAELELRRLARLHGQRRATDANDNWQLLAVRFPQLRHVVVEH